MLLGIRKDAGPKSDLAFTSVKWEYFSGDVYMYANVDIKLIIILQDRA